MGGRRQFFSPSLLSCINHPPPCLCRRRTYVAPTNISFPTCKEEKNLLCPLTAEAGGGKRPTTRVINFDDMHPPSCHPSAFPFKTYPTYVNTKAPLRTTAKRAFFLLLFLPPSDGIKAKAPIHCSQALLGWLVPIPNAFVVTPKRRRRILPFPFCPPLQRPAMQTMVESKIRWPTEAPTTVCRGRKGIPFSPFSPSSSPPAEERERGADTK